MKARTCAPQASGVVLLRLAAPSALHLLAAGWVRTDRRVSSIAPNLDVRIPKKAIVNRSIGPLAGLRRSCRRTEIVRDR